MNRFFILLLFLVVLALGVPTISVVAQPTATPRPLSADFLKRREAGAAFQLGRFYLRQRKAASLELSIGKFRTAAKLYDELGDRPGLGCALLGVGAVLGQQGRTVTAAQSYQQAIAIFRQFKGQDVAESPLVKLGFLYDELISRRRIFEYDDGLAIQPPKRGFDKNGNRIDTRFSQLDERYDVQYFNQPFVVYVEPERYSPSDDPRFAGSSDEREPVSFYRDVLAIWKLNGTESIEVATGISLMEAWASENSRIAVYYGKQAINKYQELRRTIQESKRFPSQRYVNQLADKFRFLADLLIGLGRLSEADDVLQMLKEEEFSEFVQRDATEIERLRRRVRLTPKEKALIDKYILLAERAAEIGERFQRLEDKKREAALPTDEEREFQRLSTEIADINAAFKLFLEKELVNEIGTENAKTLAADRDLQQKVREWGPGTVALTTVITENRYRVVLTTPTIQIDGKTDISAVILNKKLFAFRGALQDTAVDPRPLGKELYDILIKPIEKELAASGAKTLVWSLDGMLRYIPLSALSPDGKAYLVERFQNVMMTPKTRERVSRQDSDWRALGLGISQAQTLDLDGMGRVKLEALPAAKAELMSIVRDETDPSEKGILDGRRFLDAEFTLENLTSSLARKNADDRRGFTVVHLATHFRLGENWTNSFLLLGGGKILTLRQISSLSAIDFKDVELTTLSACNTALITATNGIEVDSLAESIQSKGGKAVLATLWSVYDQSTAELMQSFYRLKKDEPSITKAEALQRAQIKMIAVDGFKHPYFWSGFTLMGNWR